MLCVSTLHRRIIYFNDKSVEDNRLDEEVEISQFDR
jgi:hypothetical protein